MILDRELGFAVCAPDRRAQVLENPDDGCDYRKSKAKGGATNDAVGVQRDSHLGGELPGSAEIYP
jgi:hypothetical protein